MTRKSGGKNNGFNESPQSSSSEPLTIQMLMNNGSLLQALSDQIAQKLNTLMEKRVEQLERDVQYLQKENVDLKNKMIELEQYGRRNSIRIFGMQESKDEDTVAAVVQLVNSRLNIQVTNRDVDACHRLEYKNVGSQVMEQRDALIDPKFNETLNPLLRSNEQLTPTNKH
ncbi:hypothetical protein M8J76_012978 [Diaphorina citri]|nr:hypothetical protein M8J76_012978 [Diaphorina citri]